MHNDHWLSSPDLQPPKQAPSLGVSGVREVPLPNRRKAADQGWQRRFDEPIELPNRRTLRTLADAIAWMAKDIPTSEHGMKQV
jgi:hypothetical protein